MKTVRNEESKQGTTSLTQLITDPASLKMLILAGTDLLVQELHTLHACHNLIKLDISSNQIKAFPTALHFTQMRNLRLFYLHNNLFDTPESIEKLFPIKSLVYVTIFANPIAAKIGVRHYIVNKLPGLKGLDFNTITDEERSEYAVTTPRYHAFAPSTKLSWPLVAYPSESVLSEEEYLLLMYREINTVSLQYAHNSACVGIQRIVRGHLCRRYVLHNKRTEKYSNEIALRVVKKWRNYVSKRRVFTQMLRKRDIVRIGKFQVNQRCMQVLRQYLKSTREEIRLRVVYRAAALRIQRHLIKIRKRLSSHESLIDVQKNKLFYLHKDQIQLFTQIMNTCRNRLLQQNTANSMQEKILKCLSLDNISAAPHLATLRVAETLDCYYSPNAYAQFVKPALQSKFLLFKRGERQHYGLSSEHPVLIRLKQKVALERRKKLYNLASEDHLHDVAWCAKLKRLEDKIAIFQKEQYHKLVSFECQDDEVLRTLLKQILVHNAAVRLRRIQNKSTVNSNSLFLLTQREDEFARSKRQVDSIEETEKQSKPEEDVQEDRFYSEQTYFFIYPEQQIQEVSSAIKVQKWWRQRLVRQQEIFPILRRQRALQRICHFIYDLQYRHRLSFLHYIEQYVMRQINSSTLYVEQELYFRVQRIMYNANQAKIQKILEQHCNIEFNAQKKICRLTWQQQVNALSCDDGSMSLAQKKLQALDQVIKEIKSAGKRNILPFTIPELEESTASDGLLTRGDWQHVLHVGAKVALYRQGIGQQFIQFEYASLAEARYRAFAIALLTYKFTFGGVCVRLLTPQHLEDIPYVVHYEAYIRAGYNIELRSPQQQQNNTLLAKGQQCYYITPIQNKKCLFVCFNIQSETMISESMQKAEYFGAKRLQMYVRLHRNKNLTKVENNVFVFVTDNFYKQKSLRQRLQESSTQQQLPVMAVGIEKTDLTSQKSPQSRGLTIKPVDANLLQEWVKPESLNVFTRYQQLNNRRARMDSKEGSVLGESEEGAEHTHYSKYKDLNSTGANIVAHNSTLAATDKVQMHIDYAELARQQGEEALRTKRTLVEETRKRSLFVREFREAERIFNLNRCKTDTSKQVARLREQLVAAREREFGERLEKVAIIQKRNQIAHREDESQFLQKFACAQNFIAQQHARFHVKKTAITAQRQKHSRVRALISEQYSASNTEDNKSSSHHAAYKLRTLHNVSNDESMEYKQHLSQRLRSASRRTSQDLSIVHHALDTQQHQQEEDARQQHNQTASEQSSPRLPAARHLRAVTIAQQTMSGYAAPNNRRTGLHKMLPALSQAATAAQSGEGTYVHTRAASLAVSGIVGVQEEGAANSVMPEQQQSPLGTINPVARFAKFRNKETGRKIGEKFIHAVFPEEFYPIANTKNKIKLK